MKKIVSFVLAILLLLSVFSLTAFAKEPFGTVVEAEYTGQKPDMSKSLPDDSWGKMTAHVTNESENAAIITYHKNSGTVSEDLYCDVYFRWDDDNLYCCFVSFDDYIRGASSHHTGDGILLDIVYGITDMSHFNSELADNSTTWRNTFCYSVTFADDNKSVDFDGATLNIREDPVIYYDEAESKMVVKIAIPMTVLGLGKKNTPKDGDILSFSMCRLEGQAADGYVGWLEWGNYYDSTKETEDTAANTASIGVIELAKTVTGNSIKLVGKDSVEPETDEIKDDTPAEPETSETPATPAEQPSSWAKAEVDAAISEGLVPDDLRKNYTQGISRGDLAKMLSALIDKAYGRAPEKTDSAFTDTTDADVLRAADLGIITGYDDGTFKPEKILKRSEMSVIINRVAKLCGKTVTGFDSEVKFTDTATHWCNKELGWPVHNGIVKGTSDTTFSPENTLTVEQTIMMIYRTYEALK